jgi:dienelactone hydrolase
MSERSIVFGNGLVGTVSIPDGYRGRVGLVLLNAGVVHRVGPHRINVRLARRLAAEGVASIRFDLAGQGDSARAAGEHSYQAQAVLDIRAAMDALGTEAGIDQFAIFGFCSGAHHGYPTALADTRVAGLMIYDAFLYATRRSRLNHYLIRIRQHGLFRAVWGRLQRMARAAVKRVGKAEGKTVEDVAAAGFTTIPTLPAFAEGLRTLLARNVDVAIINSGGFEIYNYAGQFHDAFAVYGFGERIRTQFLPDVNHTATVLAAQGDFVQRIAQWMVALDKARQQDS